MSDFPTNVDVVVGLPSYNERNSIVWTTKTVDEGLKRYFEDQSALIVNVDSNSTDGTREVFSGVDTKAPKYVLNNKNKERGKGSNVQKLFELFLQTKAKTLLLIDSDVVSVAPEWVKNLGWPVRDGYDHVFPVYVRGEYDASITNHLCYPLLMGLFGVDIEQPIAGEGAFSRRAVENFMKQPWEGEVFKFGIDIFMTIASVVGGMRLVRVPLGAKIHNPSEGKLNEMFIQVAESLFRQVERHKEIWQSEQSYTEVPLELEKIKAESPHVTIDYKVLKDLAAEELEKQKAVLGELFSEEINELVTMYAPNNVLSVTKEMWMRFLFDVIDPNLPYSSEERAKMIRPLYFGRFLTFFKEALDLDHESSQRLVREQAQMFYEGRAELVKR
jgi:hypothetical protein